MNHDLTEGKIVQKLLKFAFPIMVGNLLQQLYNVVDTLIVGRYLGENALAAVGSSYALMVFITSIENKQGQMVLILTVQTDLMAPNCALNNDCCDGCLMFIN